MLTYLTYESFYKRINKSEIQIVKFYLQYMKPQNKLKTSRTFLWSKKYENWTEREKTLLISLQSQSERQILCTDFKVEINPKY